MPWVAGAPEKISFEASGKVFILEKWLLFINN